MSKPLRLLPARGVMGRRTILPLLISAADVGVHAAEMVHDLSYPEAERLVRPRSALMAEGWTSRELTDAVARGHLIRVQRNRYVRAEVTADLWPEAAHRIEIAAAVAEMRGGPGVVSYESAAVLWGLPLYRLRPSAVHMSMPGDARMSSRLRVRRHADRLADDEVCDVEDVRCTTVERTVWDVIRTVPTDAALAIADAAFRLVSADERADPRGPARLREALFDRCAAKGVRGVRPARRIADIADGRAESPGESVTRLRLLQLGFEHIDLQVPVIGPDGQTYRADLELQEEGVFVEFDGIAKYRDSEMMRGRSLDDLLLAEKRREDWIRGVTGKRIVRVMAEHIASPEALRARLAAFGIPSPFRR